MGLPRPIGGTIATTGSRFTSADRVAPCWGAASTEEAAVAAVDLATGTTVLVPAALAGAEAAFDPGATLLRITVRSPLDGLIA